MSVSDSIQVATCWSCHEHETDEHFRVDQQCESCHVPLAGYADLSADEVSILLEWLSAGAPEGDESQAPLERIAGG